MLPSHTGGLGAAAEEIVKDQMLDLVAISFAKALEGSKPRVSSARSLALSNLRAAWKRDLPTRLSTRKQRLLWLGMFRHDPLLAAVQNGVWLVTKDYRRHRCEPSEKSGVRQLPVDGGDRLGSFTNR